MPSQSYETIIVERSEAGVVTITMNRPARKNAINNVMWKELLAEFVAVSRSPSDRVLVVTGAGGAFCSGADLDPEDLAHERHWWYRMADIGEVALALQRVSQPTIAKVGGVAAGAGLNLALGCDLIVASDEARFTEIFARRGLSLDFGGSWLLPRLIGLHRAKELALFGDIISAKEAAEFGLVNRVVSAAELDGFVDGWAARLAAGPPIALAQTKRLLNNSFQVTLAQALDDEAWAQSVNFGTDDSNEALAAFNEKRDPTFTGK